MSFIDFDDRLKTGNKVIDQENQNRVRLINVLQQSIEVGADDLVIDNVLAGLKD